LLARQRADSALPHLEQAARLDPERRETSFAFGQALLDAGRAGEAIPHLRRALDAGVRPDLAGFDLARALAATGDRQGALKVLASVAPARSDDAASWYGLGQLAQQLRDPRLAARFDPREQLGLMLAMLGDFEAAVREFEAAVKLQPSDATARLNLAVGYARVGRTAEAKAQAQEALRLDPRYERASELLKVLPR
jgi:Flp pilus assembly protein TadD